VEAEGANAFRTQDRSVARNFWARKVARGLLLNAAKDLNYVNVDLAFGGSGRVLRELVAEENLLGELLNTEDDNAQAVQGVDLFRAGGEDAVSAWPEQRYDDGSVDMNEDESMDQNQDEVDDMDDEDDDNEFGNFDSGDGDHSASTSDADEEDGVPNLGASRYIYRSAMQRRQSRHRVEAGTPCSKPTREYRGHCNVRTVKDVNYFGPNDEYVVSGSDDGNFFIWDRRTSELINVLEGDGEVVNVIQGHPYETMLAVSGIDHTIKIFSPDARAREVARRGQGVSAHDPSSFSSLAWPMRIGRRQMRRTVPEGRDDDSTSRVEPALTAEGTCDMRLVLPLGLC
jgi:nuclear receptor interaction protein